LNSIPQQLQSSTNPNLQWVINSVKLFPQLQSSLRRTFQTKRAKYDLYSLWYNEPTKNAQVFIVTGGASGIGKELVQILYSHNAKIYIAARSSEKAATAIESIKTSFPDSKGELVYLHLDLDDLTTIKASAQEFLNKEQRLDVLWNNAGVMVPPQGSKTKQGYELQLGTNDVAPFLFTKLLTPTLVKTAKESSPGAVRVVWVSSSIAEGASPKGGLDLSNLDYKKDQGAWHKYAVSKAGNILHSKEFAKRYGSDGVISVVCCFIAPSLRILLMAHSL
jgi:NAD(P)-dependent dehydrogenase (short-subunit alcohol dehydrogenase family)